MPYMDPMGNIITSLTAYNIHQVIQSDRFGMVQWLLQMLSDLQLGDNMVTLNHLVYI